MHGNSGGGIIMRGPDGSPLTRKEVILMRRGAFKWLPVYCSNDLVHGSWWFVFGSIVTTLSSIYPLVTKYVYGYEQEDDMLPSTNYDISWILLVISGIFFILGSLAFVRAFEEPPQRALFHDYKHFQTDELLGAWLFLFGTCPAIPYILVFFMIEPSAIYFFALILAIFSVLASYCFVLGCYPTEKKRVDYVLPIMMKIFGPHMWVVKHLANDWLAGTWIFLVGNVILAFGTFILMLIAIGIGNEAQIFIYTGGFLCSALFCIGSLYFVSGSYPHALQFYYITDGGAKSGGGEGLIDIIDHYYANDIEMADSSKTKNSTTKSAKAAGKNGAKYTELPLSEEKNPLHKDSASKSSHRSTFRSKRGQVDPPSQPLADLRIVNPTLPAQLEQALVSLSKSQHFIRSTLPPPNNNLIRHHPLPSIDEISPPSNQVDIDINTSNSLDHEEPKLDSAYSDLTASNLSNIISDELVQGITDNLDDLEDNPYPSSFLDQSVQSKDSLISPSRTPYEVDKPTSTPPSPSSSIHKTLSLNIPNIVPSFITSTTGPSPSLPPSSSLFSNESEHSNYLSHELEPIIEVDESQLTKSPTHSTNVSHDSQKLSFESIEEIKLSENSPVLETHLNIEIDAEPEPEPESKSESEVIPESKPHVEPNVEPNVDPDVQPEIEIEADVEADVDVDADAEAEAEAESNFEADSNSPTNINSSNNNKKKRNKKRNNRKN